MKDQATAGDHIRCQHRPAEPIGAVISQQQGQLRFVRQPFDDVRYDFDKLSGDIQVRDKLVDLRDAQPATFRGVRREMSRSASRS
jgi:hypothetical protein